MIDDDHDDHDNGSLWYNFSFYYKASISRTYALQYNTHFNLSSYKKLLHCLHQIQKELFSYEFTLSTH